MNDREARKFLKGEMDFTPQRMMRYIRSRARLATDEDVEDILQSALILVVKHFDPNHPDAKLSLYCLGACNKAIAQNLERYHKVVLRKKDPEKTTRSAEPTVASGELNLAGQTMKVSTLAPGKSFNEGEQPSAQWRTTSLDSLFADDDGRSAEDVFGWEYNLSGSHEERDPAAKTLLNDLIDQVLAELPPGIHRTCFLLKYVQGYKREDLISCLKMDAKSIDTVDKKIVRTLKAFKERMEQDETRI
ncbi:MAG: hypothetical protein K2W82_12360 [Candidatus Obscuribacterales bacterium]|nr:hypothetical protein [Candidatus Obscuribacterales bacterium]